MELVDLTDLAKETEFRVFRSVADFGGRVRGINAKGAAGKYSRKGIDELTDYVVEDFPDMVRVLPDVESAEVPVFLAYPEELRQSKRTMRNEA